MEEIRKHLENIQRDVNSLLQEVKISKRVLNMDEVAALTGVSKSFLYKLTCEKRIPHYKPSGKYIYFNRKEVEEWMLQNPPAQGEGKCVLVSKKLRYVAKGTKLYSPVCGNVILNEVCYNEGRDKWNYSDRINCEVEDGETMGHPYIDFEEFGRVIMNGTRDPYMNGECMLFPSKDERDWHRL